MIWDLDQADRGQIVLFCSVTKSCPTICSHMDYSMPGLPVPHCLLVFAQTHVHWVNGRWCYPTISSSAAPFSFWLQCFSLSGSFPMSWFFPSGGRSIRASASGLPVNIQGWFPLGLTGLILLSKGLSRVQHYNSKVSVLRCSAFFMVQFSHVLLHIFLILRERKRLHAFHLIKACL